VRLGWSVRQRPLPACVVRAVRDWEAIEETLEVLQDEKSLTALRERDEHVKAGRLFSLDEVRRELGLA
jgi:PHD/YefM family antitoxin component YafN of YafNO toxin-antitoxin module